MQELQKQIDDLTLSLSRQKYNSQTREEYLTTSFSGSVASDGTATYLPSGWASSKNSTGNYTIAHPMKTTNYSIVVTPVANANIISTTYNHGLTTFIVTGITANSGAPADTAFDFIVYKRKLPSIEDYYL